MSSHPGKSEPTVMDEEILREAAMKQHPKDQAAGVSKAQGINLNQVNRLSLEYILMIDHLWEFTSLTMLYLNNNLIEKIEGLDHLINLTWLNLSFNRIGKIEGLESLQKLEVLNLSNNRISVIENMDKLEKLTHFCIANNLIEQLDNVLYLRKLKNLFTINLSGNPVSTVDDYKLFIAAYFPNLMCLDYRVLNEKMVSKNSGVFLFGDVVLKVQAVCKFSSVLQDAFVEFLNGSSLFKSMFKDDPEAETLHCLPEVAQLLQNEMVELCMQLFQTGLSEHKRRETEVNSFFSGQDKTVTDYQQKASQILANFEQQHKKVSLCFRNVAVCSFQDIIKKLDSSISDMVGNFSEIVQGIYLFSWSNLEDNYHQNVRKVAVETLEKVAKDDTEDMSNDVRMLFTDKDTVMDALATGHDNHLMKINDRENLLVTRINAWKAALIKGIQDKELKWNRIRISDIHRYMDHLKEQLEELQ
uniref:Dynein regulatory complex subunit 3 n=1 Tax=Anabas testudineus TaxID=64144 RepID=A0AAQ6IJB3_ANATE